MLAALAACKVTDRETAHLRNVIRYLSTAQSWSDFRVGQVWHPEHKPWRHNVYNAADEAEVGRGSRGAHPNPTNIMIATWM